MEEKMSETKIIRDILEHYKTIAVVGLSKDPTKDSYDVAQFLKSRGYHIIPINPTADKILGEKSYPSLLELPEDLKQTVEVVDIFRRPEDVPPIVDQTIQLRQKYGKPHVVWMQLGIINEEAARKAKDAGMTVIMNRCMRIERRKLEAEKDENDAELQQIRQRKMQELTEKMDRKQEGGRNTPITLDDAHFNEEVKKHSLMLIDCWAVWCGPCRMIAPVIDELAQEYTDRLVIAKLNVDENPQTAEQFGVMSIPTLLIMKNGVEVDRIIGAVPKHFIEEKLKKHM